MGMISQVTLHLVHSDVWVVASALEVEALEGVVGGTVNTVQVGQSGEEQDFTVPPMSQDQDIDSLKAQAQELKDKLQEVQTRLDELEE